jgi:hypothetical protein
MLIAHGPAVDRLTLGNTKHGGTQLDAAGRPEYSRDAPRVNAGDANFRDAGTKVHQFVPCLSDVFANTGIEICMARTAAASSPDMGGKIKSRFV